jgi:putative acetyltransferase
VSLHQPLALRKARPEDGAVVQRIVFDTLRAFGIAPEPEGMDRDVTMFGNHDESIDDFVAEVDGAVVGSIMLSPRSAEGAAGEGWVSKFFVDPRYRGRGIGRALLARVIAAARERGYARLALDTRDVFGAAKHLYESTGWKRSAEPPANGRGELLYTIDL